MCIGFGCLVFLGFLVVDQHAIISRNVPLGLNFWRHRSVFENEASLQAVEIAGKHMRTLPVEDGSKYGITVTPDCLYMAISYHMMHKVLVYRIEATGTLTLLHSVGGNGVGPKQFRYPFKMCLTPTGNLMVCEYANSRVQELTGPSESEPVHVRHLTGITQPWTVAVHADLVAVGTYKATVVLLSYSSGATLRTIGTPGVGRGCIGGRAEGLRFTQSGLSIIVAEHANHRLSQFGVSDGAFEAHYCINEVSNGQKDVEIAPTGDVIIADYDANRVSIFRADGRTLQRTWGALGTADGEFKNPTALALVGNKLFVLDCGSPRVQVFV